MVKVPKGYRSDNVEDRRRGPTSGSSPARRRTSSAGPSMSDLLGGILGANATGGGLLGGLLGGGGLGDILGSVMGGGGLGSILGPALGGAGDPSALSDDDRRRADDDATLLIRAMVNAAKADGRVDQAEVDNIVSRLGDIDPAEAEFLRAEFRAPLDVEAFCRSVPADLAEQAYAFSVMGMKLDTRQEAQYLGAVASGLGLDAATANAIHDKLGAPPIFR